MQLLGKRNGSESLVWSTDTTPNVPVPIALQAEPAPCAVCGKQTYWVDVYGAVHCCVCDFPPMLAVIKSLVGAVETGDGKYAWQDFTEEFRGPFSQHFSSQAKRRRQQAEQASG